MNQTSQRRVLISGANGLVGSELFQHLQSAGYQVLPLIRPHSKWDGEALRWEPSKQVIDKEGLTGIEAVIHLSGESIANGRWTKEKKRRIRDSRVDGTRFLAETISQLPNPPKTFICASAVGFYGDRGDEVLDEDSFPGEGFLPQVCQEWEAAAAPARDQGIRTVHTRFGVILTGKGGALKQMLFPFKMGMGGKLGSGRQYMPWISLTDTINAIQFALETQSINGPVNVTAPCPVTNTEFTKTLGTVLSRPTILPAPAFALKMVLGEMANDLLLASTRAVPKTLQENGFQFQHEELEKALHECLK